MRRGLPSDEGYGRYASQYDEKEKFWDSFEQNAYLSYIVDSKDKKVLDAGAGTGRVSVRLAEAGADVTALDICPEMLNILKTKTSKIKTVVGDMEHMPFEDDSFDMVFSALSLIHLKKIEPFLDECYRVLKNDGKLVLVNIHYRKPEMLHDSQGRYTIQAYNHYPKHIVKTAEHLAFTIEKNEILTEGDDVWVSQVIVLRK